LPELKDTLSKWILTAKPHLTTQEFEKTQRLAASFLNEAGPLQSYLKEKASTNHNWVRNALQWH